MKATLERLGTVISEETFAELWADAPDLLISHWHEIAAFKDIPLSVDVARYEALERNGALRIVTARVDGALVGYAVFIVATHGHYQGSTQAMQDVFYVHPDYRGIRLGLKLIKVSEALLRAAGCQVVHQHVKCEHPELGGLLEHQGYVWVERIYSKRLDKD